MSQYAVVKISHSQFRVEPGEEILIPKAKGKKDDLLTFDQVLLLVEEGKVKIGQPLLKGVAVSAKILVQEKGKKIRVATYKAKSRYRRVKGFRPQFTRIKIEKITSS